jgi:hypothetical protein
MYPIAAQDGTTDIVVEERLEFVESPTALDAKFQKTSKSVPKTHVSIFLLGPTGTTYNRGKEFDAELLVGICRDVPEIL